MAKMFLDFGRVFKQRRRSIFLPDGRVMTLLDVASALGLGKATISEFENKGILPRLRTARSYATLLGLDFEATLERFPEVAAHYKRQLTDDTAGARL